MPPKNTFPNGPTAQNPVADLSSGTSATALGAANAAVAPVIADDLASHAGRTVRVEADAAATAGAAASEAARDMTDAATTAAVDTAESLRDVGTATAEAAGTMAEAQREAIQRFAIPGAESWARSMRQVPFADSTRLAAMMDVPRIWGGFAQRQARRTLDGFTALATSRSLTDALDIQQRLARESMEDFVEANVHAASSTVAAVTGSRPDTPTV